MKSACCVLQTYLHKPECCFHFIIQLLQLPVGWLLHVGLTTSEGTGLDMLVMEVRTKYYWLNRTGNPNKTGQRSIVKGCRQAWQMLNIYVLSVHAQTSSCATHPRFIWLLFDCDPSTHLRTTNVLFPPPVGSCSALHHPPPHPKTLPSHFWSGSFTVKKSAIIHHLSKRAAPAWNLTAPHNAINEHMHQCAHYNLKEVF